MKKARIESDIAKRIEKHCRLCGKPYYLAPVQSFRRAIGFCGIPCRLAFQESRKIQRTCKWCGVGFSRSASQIESAGGDKRCQFCSKSCAGAYAIRYCQSRVSAIEGRFFDALEKRGIQVKRQSKVAGYNVDGLAVDWMAVIEFDGVYWHEKPATAALDANKERLFRENGFRVIRVRDTDFKSNSTRVIQRVLAQLQSPQGMLFPV